MKTLWVCLNIITNTSVNKLGQLGETSVSDASKPYNGLASDLAPLPPFLTTIANLLISFVECGLWSQIAKIFIICTS